jgi:hypothetical protein
MPSWPPPPKIIGRVRSTPRVWGREMETLAQILINQAWIIRRVRGTGTTRGAPNYTQDAWGPYPALVADPTAQERRDADRYETDLDATCSIGSDIRPYVSDFIDVIATQLEQATATQGETPVVRYRVLHVTDARARFSVESVRPVYHMSLQLLSED